MQLELTRGRKGEPTCCTCLDLHSTLSFVAAEALSTRFIPHQPIPLNCMHRLGAATGAGRPGRREQQRQQQRGTDGGGEQRAHWRRRCYDR